MVCPVETQRAFAKPAALTFLDGLNADVSCLRRGLWAKFCPQRRSNARGGCLKLARVLLRVARAAGFSAPHGGDAKTGVQIIANGQGARYGRCCCLSETLIMSADRHGGKPI